MTPEQENLIKYATLLGDFKGTLMGILMWEIPEELKIILRDKITHL